MQDSDIIKMLKSLTRLNLFGGISNMLVKTHTYFELAKGWRSELTGILNMNFAWEYWNDPLVKSSE